MSDETDFETSFETNTPVRPERLDVVTSPLIQMLARQIMAASNIGNCPAIRVDLAQDLQFRRIRPPAPTFNAQNLNRQNSLHRIRRT